MLQKAVCLCRSANHCNDKDTEIVKWDLYLLKALCLACLCGHITWRCRLLMKRDVIALRRDWSVPGRMSAWACHCARCLLYGKYRSEPQTRDSMVVDCITEKCMVGEELGMLHWPARCPIRRLLRSSMALLMASILSWSSMYTARDVYYIRFTLTKR